MLEGIIQFKLLSIMLTVFLLACLAGGWLSRHLGPSKLQRKSDREMTAFFWQAGFILLPVAGLAAFGLYSLQQDRMFAGQEAREAGEVLAQRLAQAVSAEGSQQFAGLPQRKL